jgi:hypothetical protein
MFRALMASPQRNGIPLLGAAFWPLSIPPMQTENKTAASKNGGLLRCNLDFLEM